MINNQLVNYKGKIIKFSELPLETAKKMYTDSFNTYRLFENETVKNFISAPEKAKNYFQNAYISLSTGLSLYTKLWNSGAEEQKKRFTT